MANGLLKFKNALAFCQKAGDYMQIVIIAEHLENVVVVVERLCEGIRAQPLMEIDAQGDEHELELIIKHHIIPWCCNWDFLNNRPVAL